MHVVFVKNIAKHTYVVIKEGINVEAEKMTISKYLALFKALRHGPVIA